jgi:hypothetical protein
MKRNLRKDGPDMHSSVLGLVAVSILIMIIFGARNSAREWKRTKRSKKILDRYNPERSKRPLGL